MKIGVVVFPKVEELDFVGPWELFGLWARQPEGPGERLLVAESLAPVPCANGLSVNPHAAFATCPDLDCLVVPGGQGTRTEVDNPALIAFIQRQARCCRALLSVCTGAFLLQRAGLLAGRRAATHWASLDRLRAFREVTVAEERFVRDGALWSSAGVSAGMDMTLAFIASEAGPAAAGKVQLAAEYFPLGRVYEQPRPAGPMPAYLKGVIPTVS